MKNILKKAIFVMAIMISASMAFGQEVGQSSIKPFCYDEVYVTFGTIVSVVPAGTTVELIVHFKPEFVSLYGVSSKLSDRHEGYVSDKQTPFTYSKMCMTYPPAHAKALELRVYYGGGSNHFNYYFQGYTNTITINAAGPWTGSGASPY